jgi:hypothetical protein
MRTIVSLVTLAAAMALAVAADADTTQDRKKKVERSKATVAATKPAERPPVRTFKPDPSPAGAQGPYDNYTRDFNPFDYRSDGSLR